MVKSLKKIQRMRRVIFYVLLLVPFIALCQTGSHKQLSEISLRFDLICKNEEIMIPRAALKSRSDKSTIVDKNTKFILVFNTAKGPQISTGYYYWYNNKWNDLKNLTEESGIPRTNGQAGDLFLDFSTRDVYFYNGTIWLAMTTHNKTLTESVFEKNTGILSYKDGAGEPVEINLSQIVPNFEKPKTISLNAKKETLNYIDNDGRLTVLKLDVLLAKSKNTNVTAAF